MVGASSDVVRGRQNIGCEIDSRLIQVPVVIFHSSDRQIEDDYRIACHPICVCESLPALLPNRRDVKKVELVCGVSINVALEELLNSRKVRRERRLSRMAWAGASPKGGGTCEGENGDERLRVIPESLGAGRVLVGPRCGGGRQGTADV